MVKTAFVFPGQGSQSLGMLSDFELQYPIIKNTFEEASEAVGFDLWQLAQQGPEDRLNQTEYTQLIVLAADVAVYRLLRQQGVPSPLFMAGHSLGEYAALVCADALSLSDALRLVKRRGQLMQGAVPIGLGVMAAIIGLTDEQVLCLCKQATQGNEIVAPASYNAVGQVVVAGHQPAVSRALVLAEEEGALMTKVIPVSVPCHCPLLYDAAEVFAESLHQTAFSIPSTGVISNVDLSLYQSVDQIRNKLKEQLYSPVRWVETIQLLKKRQIGLILECGPGRVLGGLIKRIERDISVISVYDTISLDQVIEQLSGPVDMLAEPDAGY